MPPETLMNRTCDLYAPKTRVNGLSGYENVATASNIKCRIEPSGREFRANNGDIVRIDAILFIPPNVTISEQYKVVSDGRSYIVEAVSPIYGFSELSHYECMLRGI